MNSIQLIKSLLQAAWLGFDSQKGQEFFCHHVHPPLESTKPPIQWVLWEGVDLIHLSQDKDQWQALVNMVMNL
jgi:hypothetical protein